MPRVVVYAMQPRPRRGWSELINEIISFAKKAATLAALWRGDDAILRVSKEIRKIAGFGGKGPPEKHQHKIDPIKMICRFDSFRFAVRSEDFA